MLKKIAVIVFCFLALAIPMVGAALIAAARYPGGW